MNRIFIILILSLMWLPTWASKIIVSGQLNSNTTWSADSVLIDGTVIVESGVTLKIDAGVAILGGRIELEGAIQAIGTRINPISFRNFDNGNPNEFKIFQGIRWDNVKASNDSSLIKYCIFEKLGNDALFDIRTSNKVAIRKCHIDGKVVRNEKFLYSLNSNTIFENNLVINFKDRAMEFAGGTPLFKGNTIDSCLNYKYGTDLLYFGGGTARIENNIFKNCGDSLNPSEVYPTIIFRNECKAIFKNNRIINSWNLALRIEDESSPQIIESTIKNCYAGVLLSKTHATQQVVFRKTTIDGIAEAGVYAGIDVRAYFVDCSIKNCMKSGVTVVRDSEMEFDRDSFINNEGCGLYVAYLTTNVDIDNCYFEGNSAKYGGGLFLADRSNSYVNNSTFINNIATNGGGLSSGSGSVIQDCIFTGNRAYSYGGGAFVQGSTFLNNKLTKNRAYMGGGLVTQISSYYKSAYEENYIAQNYADSIGGGAIAIIDRYVKFRNNHLENNSAAYAGGGLAVYAGSRSWISGLLINNNEAPFAAGISFQENGNNEIRLSNLTVAYNKSSKKYGAMRNKSKDELFFTNCAFWGNESSNGADFYSEWDNLDPWFENCVVQGGQSNFDLNGGNYNGTWKNNSESDPVFNNVTKSGVDLSQNYRYQFGNNSNLYNGGKADTSGLRMLKKDLVGTDRIKDGRIDIGAFEYIAGPSINTFKHPIAGCENANLIFEIDAKGGGLSYTWVRNADTLLQNSKKLTISNFSMTDTGTYYVIVSNSAGYVTSNQVRLLLSKQPIATLNAVDTSLCSNNHYELRTIETFENYKWSNGKLNEGISVNKTGEYWVEVTDENGCSTISDTVNITITKPKDISGLDLSPSTTTKEWDLTAKLGNGDGIDSIQWFRDSKYLTGSAGNVISVDKDKFGDYKLVGHYKGCVGDTSKSFSVIFESVVENAFGSLQITQIDNYLQLQTESKGSFLLNIYSLVGQELLTIEFSSNVVIDVSPYRNQIVLIQLRSNSLDYDALTVKQYIK